MAYDSSKEIRDVLASIDKNDRGDKIQITEIQIQGRTGRFIDVRLMYTPDGTDELRPTSKGVRFSDDMLLDVVKGLVKGMSDDDQAELMDYIEEITHDDSSGSGENDNA